MLRSCCVLQSFTILYHTIHVMMWAVTDFIVICNFLNYDPMFSILIQKCLLKKSNFNLAKILILAKMLVTVFLHSSAELTVTYFLHVVNTGSRTSKVI